MILSRVINLTPNMKIAPLMGFPGISITGGTLAENVIAADKQFATIAALYERFNPDFVFPMMDLTVEAEALGAPVRFPLNEPPSVEKEIIATFEDIKNLKIPEVNDGNRLSVYIETLTLLVKNLPESVIKCGYIMGPFSLAGALMGAGEMSMKIVLEPQMAHDLLQFCTEFLHKYLLAMLSTGADSVWILEPTASLVSPGQAEEFSNRYLKPLIKTCREHGQSPVLHNCGKIGHLVEGYNSLDIEGLSIGSCHTAEELIDKLRDDLVLIGNLDPAGVLNHGRPEQVASETKKLIRSVKGARGRRKNFILSTGCDLPLSVPLENIEAFIKTGREYGAG